MRPALGIWLFYATAVAAVLAGHAMAMPATPSPVVTGKLTSTDSTGTALVFLPNPVQTTGDQKLTDAKDAADAVPDEAYVEVQLTDLDGSGYLRGSYANVRSSTGRAAYTPTDTFVYDRHDDRFEQVMAYFWGTEAQHYLQSLGFAPDGPLAVNAESQDFRINQWGLDNSFSWDKHDYIKLGKGGVDDAEDGEVIVHEYGHAVHDSQVPGFGSSPEAGAIGEGFSDYLAVTVGLHVAGKYGQPVGDAACVADWDATSYTSREPHCLRRVDGSKTYADVVGEVHRDGEIWSRALWDIRSGLPSTTVADRIIIEAQFDFAPDTSFSDAAKATIDKAQEIGGGAVAAVVTKAFQDRGIPGI